MGAVVKRTLCIADRPEWMGEGPNHSARGESAVHSKSDYSSCIFAACHLNSALECVCVCVF